MSKRDFYEILGVAKNASEDDIKKAEQAIHQFIEEAFNQNGFKQVEHQPNLHDGCKWCPFYKTFHCSATYHTH